MLRRLLWRTMLGGLLLIAASLSVVAVRSYWVADSFTHTPRFSAGAWASRVERPLTAWSASLNSGWLNSQKVTGSEPVTWVYAPWTGRPLRVRRINMAPLSKPNENPYEFYRPPPGYGVWAGYEYGRFTAQPVARRPFAIKREQVQLPGFGYSHVSGLLLFGGSETSVSVDISLWWLVALTAALPLTRMWTGWRRRRQPKDCCIHCEYDLAGNTSGVCPECGTEVVDGGICQE